MNKKTWDIFSEKYDYKNVAVKRQAYIKNGVKSVAVNLKKVFIFY